MKKKKLRNFNVDQAIYNHYNSIHYSVIQEYDDAV